MFTPKVLLNASYLVITLLIGSLLTTLALADESRAEAPWLDQAISPADARHLLSRTGFDASPEAQLTLAGLTRREAIDEVISGFNTHPIRPMPAWTQDVAPLYWARRDLDNEQRRNFDRLRDQELSQLRGWWVDEMLTTSSPQTERMVLFWHDHFATSYRGIDRQSMAMARQNQTFRELGMGDMSSLLHAMIRDPALLRYLNNISNKRRKPNENLARELMELFTLGEGNYEEETVREAARTLTGYSVSANRNLQPRFNFWQHDPKEKTLFGETGRFDADDLIAILLKQPALDRFIATRFWHWLVADRAPSEIEIMSLANAFRASGHRLDLLYRNTLESEAFWHVSNRGGLIKSPVTLLIGTARALEAPKRINHQIPRLLKLAGQDLFAPPNVSGWQEGGAWVTPGRLLNRYSALETLLEASRGDGAVQMSGMDNSAMAMKEDAVDANDAMVMVDKGTHARRAFTLRLASEEFNGPARYKLELLDSSSSVIWASGERVLSGGWDTKRYGLIDNRDEMPWQTIALAFENNLLAKSQAMRVHFVNDAAGDGGDRNLYVGALGELDSRAYPKPGTQVSACAPSNGADVGDLYCNGYVDIDLTALQDAMPIDSTLSIDTTDVHYASKHVHWAGINANNGQVSANVVFQDVRFGQRHWPIFTAQYRVTKNDPPSVWLHNQDCWPDCIEQWPSCAWVDERDPLGRTISISAFSESGDEQVCHTAALQDDEARMVDGLLIHSVNILNDVLKVEREQSPNKRSNIKNGLVAMIDRMQQTDVVESLKQSSPTGRTALENVPLWVQNDAAQRPYPDEKPLGKLALLAGNLATREQQIHNHGFSWASTLAPGIELSQLPGWGEDSKEQDDESTVIDRVRDWLLNPAYQVY